jgi:hypothetical protein
MNDHIYTEQGQFYYDAEYDVYRRVEVEPMSHVQRFGWLYVIVCLVIVTAIVAP